MLDDAAIFCDSQSEDEHASGRGGGGGGWVGGEEEEQEGGDKNEEREFVTQEMLGILLTKALH